VFVIRGNDERQVEKEFFTLPISDFVKMPILLQITFIPMKAVAI